MTPLKEIIESSDFLLDFQKKALIEKLGDDAIADRRLNLMTFLDEVFRRLFDRGVEETLTAQEQREVDYVLNDLVGETDD